MFFSFNRIGIAGAVGVLVVGASACEQGPAARVPAGGDAAGQVAMAPAGGMYDPAITVYKEPT
ncbi:MAG: hypothetical protein ACSLFE_04790 [Gemmatimonadaceae bacterium]